MAGPVYYYDANLKSKHKLPRQFDRTLFIYEWTRTLIIAVKLDADQRRKTLRRWPNVCGRWIPSWS